MDKMMLQDDYRNIEGFRELKHFLKRHLFVILRNPYFQRGRKISVIVLFFSERVYRHLVFASEKKKR